MIFWTMFTRMITHFCRLLLVPPCLRRLTTTRLVIVILRCIHMSLLTEQLALNRVHGWFHVRDLTCCQWMAMAQLSWIHRAIQQNMAVHVWTTRVWPVWLHQPGSRLEWVICRVRRRVISYHTFTPVLRRCLTSYHNTWRCYRRGWVVVATDSWWHHSASTLHRLTAFYDIVPLRWRGTYSTA